MKYTFTAGQRLQIAGEGDFFRLLATVTPVNLEFYFQGREVAERLEVEAGFAEQFRAIRFDRVDITSPGAQTVQFETALGSEIRYDRGAASITGTVGLDAPTLAALEQTNVRPEEKTGSFASAAALVANTAQQVFAPAANTNGAILLSANIGGYEAGVLNITLLSKASAPTSNTDGDVYLSFTAGANRDVQLPKEMHIPAGHGLYFISPVNTTAQSYNVRSARYKLL